jgi:hypothetical protein
LLTHGYGSAKRWPDLALVERLLPPFDKRFDGIARQSPGARHRNPDRQFLSPPLNGGAGHEPEHAFGYALQRALTAATEDYEKSKLAPAAYKVGRPYRISEGSSQHPKNGSRRLLPVAASELSEFMSLDKHDAKWNLQLDESSEHFPQVRVHHGLIGQSGHVIEAAALFHAAVIWIRVSYSKLAFKSLDGAYDGAMPIA